MLRCESRIERTDQHQEGVKMKRSTIAAAGIIALALTGVGVSGAIAATPAPSSPVTDGATPGTGATEAPGTESTTETTDPETDGVSDGNDGGHADPEGIDVNHEGGADEK
jgi:hypothetical protein